MSILTGEMLIGARRVRGTHSAIHAINPATGEELEPVFGGGCKAEVEQACALADAAFDIYRETTPEARAVFLETIAENILKTDDELIVRAMQETGLPRARLEGERGRTVGQLRLFANVVREGSWLVAQIDPAMPERQPLPRADLRQRHIALGPVAVFGASNFPLAFSVAGGDTASAFAAGCPVVVKGHSAHPGTSELVGLAIRDAVAACGLPEGVFSLLFGNGNAIGTALVEDPRIKAVGFTGSQRGGTALMAAAAARPEPIPVYAEMSSINPTILMPGALAQRAEALGKGFIGSLTMGSGQFCTNPGLVLAVDGADLERFLESSVETLAAAPATTMLTPSIHAAYAGGVARLEENSSARLVARGQSPSGPNQAQGALFETHAADFAADRGLQEEVFGPASMLVRCASLEELRQSIANLEGQLTATVHVEPEDHEDVRQLLPTLERRVGRILFNGWPTGVEVCHAMVHGGPYPATSDSRTTSVGTLAINRFLRPVCYQDMPQDLLPESLADANPLHIWRRIDGSMTQP